jgi:hypothetical protein
MAFTDLVPGEQTIPRTATQTAIKPPADLYTLASNKPGAQPSREYVSADPHPQIGIYARSLPHYIDDVTRDFGDDVYERMDNDAQVFSCGEILKLNVLSEGYTLRPAVTEAEKGSPEFATEVMDFCTRTLEKLPTPFGQWLYEMLDALKLGSKISEKTWKIEEDGPDRGFWIYRYLKVKPRRTLNFVIDPFNNILGLISMIPGMAIYNRVGPIFDIKHIPNILPREKFAIFTYKARDGDPRGQSIYRPAYDAWWNKTQCKPELLKYLARFGSPSLFGTLPENAEIGAFHAVDAQGNPIANIPAGDPRLLPPEQQMLAGLQAIRSGSAAVAPYGATCTVLNASGSAGAFMNAMEYYDKQIAKAILGQTLATEEGEHQARAAAETHKNILDIVLNHVRQQVALMVKKDILYPLVLYRWGKAIADQYCPEVTVGTTSSEDWSTDLSAIATGFSAGVIKPSQLPYLWEKLGLPPATEPITPPPSAQPGAPVESPPPEEGQPPPTPRPPPAQEGGRKPPIPPRQAVPPQPPPPPGAPLPATNGAPPQGAGFSVRVERPQLARALRLLEGCNGAA